MSTGSGPSRAHQQRVVRVFVSSTFRDMQTERDILVKKTFPELRKRCRERHAEFVEVDLRWGITEEQSQRGEVLPICLAEIERCRPFFIGLLGERYGWVPNTIDPELVQQQPWLAEHREESVTELEILHGVLRNPDMADRSYFYFRDPSYTEQLPEDRRADFLSEDTQAAEKLERLKHRIRESKLPLKENYHDPETLGQLILDDLWSAIDKEFPAEAIPDPLDGEATEHEAFAQSRAKVYIGREEYFTRLDNHVKSDGPPLVLVGESGVGKSALLANWAERYRKAHPDDFMILHFIGSSPGSADYVGIMRRIIAEIRRRYDLPEEIPAAPDKLREALPLWLASAAAKGRLILILDGLNQLEDRDNAPHLGWLPTFFPANVRVIGSSLPGPSLNALEARNWPQLQVRGLQPDERQSLITQYLEIYCKELSPPQLDRVATATQTSNPLFLRALLEELRVFGVHEELDNRIDYYLEAATVPALYEKILARLEGDYEKDRPNLVADAMSAIWASRRGLYESELLELLGDDDGPLPRAVWSPLYLAMEESLVSRTGLLSFFHDYLRQAVLNRYDSKAETQKMRHVQLADYFAGKDLDDRKADELPWQLARGDKWESLAHFLTDLRVFTAVCGKGREFEWMAYWQEVQRALADAGFGGLDIAGGYLCEFRALPHYSRILVAGSLALFLKDLGFLQAAEECLILEGEFLDRGSAAFLRAANTNDRAQLLAERGEREAALELYSAAERLLQGKSQTLEDRRVLASVLMNQGNTLRELKRLDTIEDNLRRSLALMEETTGDYSPETATVLQSLGNYFSETGRHEEALSFHRRSCEVRRRGLGPEHRDVALSLANMGSAMIRLGRFYRGMECLQQALEIFLQTLGPKHRFTLQVQESLRQCRLLEE